VGRVDQALEVEVDHPVPFLGGRILDRAEQHHAGVVDDDVEPSQLVDGAIDRSDRLLLVGDVGFDRKRGVTLAADLRGKPLKSLKTAGGHGDLRPLLRQRPRRSLTNATARASDQRNGSFKWGRSHQRSRPFSRLRVSDTREPVGLLASRPLRHLTTC